MIESSRLEFFKLIEKIAFLNPFSQHRETIDRRILGEEAAYLDIHARINAIQAQLSWHIQQSGLLHDLAVSKIDDNERETVVIVWLYYQFHVFEKDFKQLLDQQLASGQKNLRPQFAEKIETCFQQAGFSIAETEKYIALFWQLHRGFYFISQHIVGEAPCIAQLRMRLWNNIFTFNPRWYMNYLSNKMEDFSTLLLGDTGTGKSLTAYTIGHSGLIPYSTLDKKFRENFTQSYQAINLAQFPASLLESELFGHKKGAFTGAVEKHDGVFARCSAHGAVFIDEIGDIDIPTQVKLLNVIQDRWFCPLGSHEKIRFSGRVIAATNRDIVALRQQGEFRDDLYYRLCSDVIEIPGLQQRIAENSGELRSLINGLIRRVVDAPDDALIDQIESQINACVPKGYHWPGNVRELEQCLRQICLSGFYHIQQQASRITQSGFVVAEKAGEVTATKLMQQYCNYLYQKHNSYEAVARITHLDRRTVKKYIVMEDDE